MDLGAFSVSLAVADLGASQRFYEALGFEVAGGEPEQNWLVMRNGTTTIGLFQGMFEGNILTFNPGWGANANEVNPFTDVRTIEAALLDAGIELTATVEPETSGPGFVTLVDPDGNAVMIDQHR